jgi:hypothetical protein
MSTKMQHQIEWRRAKVMELLSKGESNQSEIARVLQVDKFIVAEIYRILESKQKTTSKNTLTSGCQKSMRNVL